MGTSSIFVFTHDSIGVGEDGPTHQPIEHLASLRAMPGLTVFRPADANETSAAWKYALENNGPTALILTRQGLPILDEEELEVQDGASKGAYVLGRDEDAPELILMGTGSEVALAVQAAEILKAEGRRVRVVSMPSWEVFLNQPPEYRDRVLPPEVGARLALEAGVSLGWSRWVGPRGDVLCLDGFGHSAPGGEIFTHLGFTPENVAAKAREIMKK